MLKTKLFFLCGRFERKNFVYGVKLSEGDWYYFEDEDSVIDAHASLPADLENRITQLGTGVVHPIAISVDNNQLVNYIKNEKFVFKDKELDTYMQLKCIQEDQRQRKKKKLRSTDDLAFIVGKTNPAIFLVEFEKCDDVKFDKDKLYKIRNFVNEEDKQEFSTFFFKSDWPTARVTFLKKYSYAFTENKKRELSVVFLQETGLRSFFIQKINALSTYTTLTLNNQLEMILAELPNQISNLFLMALKLNCTKNEILDFCDSIQELVDGMHVETSGNVTPTVQPDQQSDIVQDMEIFNYDTSEVESSSLSSCSTHSRKRVKGTASRGRGRPRKVLKVITEDFETSQSDLMDSGQSTSTFSNF